VPEKEKKVHNGHTKKCNNVNMYNVNVNVRLSKNYNMSATDFCHEPCLLESLSRGKIYLSDAIQEVSMGPPWLEGQ
jgi:hypothetical protein